MASYSHRFYVIAIAIFGIVSYFFLIFTPWIKDFDQSFLSYLYLTIAHIFIFMLVWSMVTTMVIDPGDPEVFWVK